MPARGATGRVDARKKPVPSVSTPTEGCCAPRDDPSQLGRDRARRTAHLRCWRRRCRDHSRCPCRRRHSRLNGGRASRLSTAASSRRRPRNRRNGSHHKEAGDNNRDPLLQRGLPLVGKVLRKRHKQGREHTAWDTARKGETLTALTSVRFRPNVRLVGSAGSWTFARRAYLASMRYAACQNP